MSINNTNFNDFLNSLQKTNATLDYFTDFDKCSENVNKISMKLHSLNYLLGKKNLKQAIDELFLDNPKCFEVLNLLIAVRNKKTNLFDKNGNLVEIKSYFLNSNKIYEFFCETGLDKIFINGEITNLHDYVFGVEVGLDTNARKNRTGNLFANLVAQIFISNNIKFTREINHTDFKDLNFSDDKKRFDFVIQTQNITYLIEANFYNGGGSKLNEVARSYTEISEKISHFNKYNFIWITDGQGWFSAKNKLAEAYKSVEIYNLENLNTFIQKVKNND
nr:type II restriction endonuclease [Campylobacter sp.]